MTEERQHRELTELFEELLATLEVNRLRRVITAVNPIYEPDYEKLLQCYRTKMEALAPDGYTFLQPVALDAKAVEKVDFGACPIHFTDDMHAHGFAVYQKRCDPSKRFAYHAKHEVPAIGMFAQDKNRFCLLAVNLVGYWQKFTQELEIDGKISPDPEGWVEV